MNKKSSLHDADSSETLPVSPDHSQKRFSRYEILKGALSENRTRMKEDWHSVESMRISRYNIEAIEMEIGIAVDAHHGLLLENGDMREALHACEAALDLFLNSCDAKEIKDSFSDMAKARTQARASIAKARQA